MVKDRIAIVFDFDETLAPDSTSSFLEYIGVNPRLFWQQQVNPLRDSGWDPIPAYLYMMLKESRDRPSGKRITREQLSSYGKKIKLYNGALRVFPALRKHVEEKFSEIELEFYCISSGIQDIVGNTRIAQEFKDIWACDFHYDENSEIVFPKNIVSFTDKTRYLFYIAKGLIGNEFRSKPFEVNRKVPAEELRVPFDQMIFVGDGMTDIPCFSLIRKNGGWALGVYDPENQDKWGRAWGFVEHDRVSNLVPADYGKSSALRHNLIMATNSIAQRIELKRKTYQG